MSLVFSGLFQHRVATPSPDPSGRPVGAPLEALRKCTKKHMISDSSENQPDRETEQKKLITQTIGRLIFLHISSNTDSINQNLTETTAALRACVVGQVIGESHIPHLTTFIFSTVNQPVQLGICDGQEQVKQGHQSLLH